MLVYLFGLVCDLKMSKYFEIAAADPTHTASMNLYVLTIKIRVKYMSAIQSVLKRSSCAN